MKTVTPSLFVSAALAGIILAAAPARADHHEGEKMDGHKAMKAKKHKMGKKDAGMDKVHCMGVNACKGKGECAVEGKHACAGHNACKGQGWVTLAKKDCMKKKGTVVEPKAAEKAMEKPMEMPEKAAAPDMEKKAQ